MYTTIFAAVIALLAGFAAGTTIENETPTLDETINQTQQRHQSENPRAEDYVSLRPSVTSLPSEALSQEEIDGLILMREEEKLARDVYQTLFEQWDLQIFSNIAQSEQTHTEAVRDLIKKYDLTDPVTVDTIGVFTSKTMQQLYTDLVTAGSKSEVAALKVGATIEDLDINDLQELMAKTDNQDILLVYENLSRGSRNHLRAFTRQLTMRGETYEPQYISTTDYESIITSDQETGGRSQSGNRGWGKQNHN